MKLKIDTTNPKNSSIALDKGDGSIVEKTKEQAFGSQVLLPLIAEMLEAEKSTVADLQAIQVNPNAGSYTGTRIGVAVANALGYGLKIPVNEQVMPKAVVEVTYQA